ncbi:lipopolysaccharide transport periplasmic protein LptA [Luteimonas sp. SX5]|uniref:Lipopolysaccharide export system protein LptA n=1 Tax=Luteimonas galliterrae TaxID=2940486 RepID=A0ABT0MK40_9GAMM|nr:lipopolysaccharide transport periplasmic protein LptA [Luteimonas galliterrae]MCL1635247.1 lipopolysaccharide transport periplasmic protein LptA [Luteimonas galliterrae]
MTLRPAVSLALLCAMLAAASVASVAAKTTDRNQPMNISSDQQAGTYTDNSVNVISGNVQIQQGSLDIRSQRAEVTLKNGEASRVVFTGAPVVMKQQMDDGSPMTARADKIDYDMIGENIVLIGNAFVEQPRGSTSGPRISYNMKTGRIDSGGDGSGGRVKTTIMPKSAQAQPAQGKK